MKLPRTRVDFARKPFDGLRLPAGGACFSKNEPNLLIRNGPAVVINTDLGQIQW
jgi:hypothetical protein